MKKGWMQWAGVLAAAIVLGGCVLNPGKKEEPSSQAERGLEETVKEGGKEEKKKPRDQVENNGGYFVAVGDKVYFRFYHTYSLEQTMLWGEFLGGYPYYYGEYSEIWSYDLNTGKAQAAFSDGGNGPIFAYQDRLYLQKSGEPLGEEEEYEDVEGNPDAIYSVTLSGEDKREIASGNILAMNDKNGVFCVSKAYGASADLELWQGEEQIYSISANDPVESFQYLFCGTSGEYAFFIKSYYGTEGEDFLYSLKLEKDAEMVNLGSLGVQEVLEEEVGYTDVHKVLIQKDKGYLSMGIRAGTGNMLMHSYYYTFDVDQENSLARQNALTGGEEDSLDFTVDAQGEMQKTDHAPFSAWQEKNDLYFADEGGEKLLCKDYFPEFARGSGMEGMAQTIEYVRGHFFVMDCLVRRFKAEDVGWRWAYRRFCDRYFCLDPKENGDPEPLGTLYSEEPSMVNICLLKDEKENIVGLRAVDLAWGTEARDKYDIELSSMEEEEGLVPIGSYQYFWPISKDLVFTPVTEEGRLGEETDYQGFLKYMNEEAGEWDFFRNYAAPPQEDRYGENEYGEIDRNDPDSTYGDAVYIWFNAQGEVDEIREVEVP